MENYQEYEIFEMFNKIKREYGEQKILDLYEDKILKLKNAKLSYIISVVCKKAKVKKHEKIILECKDPEYSYKFSSNIKGADIKAHEEVIFNSGNLNFIYLFVLHIKVNLKKQLSILTLINLNSFLYQGMIIVT